MPEPDLCGIKERSGVHTKTRWHSELQVAVRKTAGLCSLEKAHNYSIAAQAAPVNICGFA